MKKENKMSTKRITIIVGLLLWVSIALAAPQAAMALTPACTPIGNTASVAYNVGGFVQTPSSSNTTTFVVGNRVNFTVTSLDASPGVPVVSNQTGALLKFQISNTGNANQTYKLTWANLASGLTTSVFSGNNSVTDAFDTASSAPTDSLGNPLTVTAVLTAGSSTIVAIQSTVPANLTNGADAVLSLTAQALKVDGSTVEANNNSSVTSAYGSCTADVVLGDAAGTDDSAHDGKFSARDAYNVVLTTLTVTKSSIVYSDPVNGLVSPKAIPGAIMEYIVGITNGGGQSATGVTISDTLTGTLLPLSGSAWTGLTSGFGPTCSGQAQVNINGGGWQCLTGGIGNSSWSGQALTATINTLSSAATATILYQATIQ